MRMLSLAAVAAAVTMAMGSGGAVSASTVLCEVTETPCKAGDRYPEKSKLKLKLQPGSKVLFTVQGNQSEILVECNEAEIIAVVTREAPFTAETTGGQLFRNNGGKCPGIANFDVTLLKLPYAISAEAAGVPGAGTLYVTKLNAERIQFELGQGLLACRYELKALSDTIEAAALSVGPPQQQKVLLDSEFKEQEPKLLCPDTMNLQAPFDLKAEKPGDPTQRQVFLAKTQ